MAEILIKAIDATHSDLEKDQRGCYKRGMPVVVMPDGHKWGNAECPPTFVIVKIPGVSIEKVASYILPEEAYLIGPLAVPELVTVRRRQWQIQFNELPLAALNKLKTTGELTIKAGIYKGTYDYTWTQVKGFFLDLKSGLRETAAI